MVRPERFELPTYSSGGCRSIQLSYGRVTLVYIGTGDLLFSNPSAGAESESQGRAVKAKSQELGT
jgi:hypothetical protein